MSNKLDRPDNAEVEIGTAGFLAFATYRRPLFAGAMFVALTGLTGCSSVPDAVNPAEWYKSTVDFFAGEDGEGKVQQEGASQTADAKPIPGEDKPFPKLSSVPERPSQPVQGGLVADTEKRKYAQPIARQGQATEMLAAQPPAAPPAPTATPKTTPAVTPVQPAPPAMPAAPVAPAPMPSAMASAPAPASMPTPSEPNFASIVPKKIQLTPPASAPTMPANAMASIADDAYTTVVVSSNGVEMAGGAAVAPAPAPAASAPAPQIATAPAAATPSFASALTRPAQGGISGTKVATILFQNGSSGLSGHDRRILREVVRLHQQRGGNVTVVGHASSRTRNMDPVKHKMVNYRLSADRAAKIAAELRGLGLDPAALLVDARSDSMPLYYEIMPSGEAGNRRAEIYFTN
jgi:flagellar motor protein MotB